MLIFSDQLANALLKRLGEGRDAGAKVEDSNATPSVSQAPQDSLAQISENISPEAKPAQRKVSSDSR